jgi:hypothetical protein
MILVSVEVQRGTNTNVLTYFDSTCRTSESLWWTFCPFPSADASLAIPLRASISPFMCGPSSLSLRFRFADVVTGAAEVPFTEGGVNVPFVAMIGTLNNALADSGRSGCAHVFDLRVEKSGWWLS